MIEKTLLQINTYGNWGSTGRIADQIGELAVSFGWKSYIACDRKIAESTSSVFKTGNAFSRYTHGCISRLFDAQGLGSVCATRKFVRKIQEIDPDVIHLHNIHGYYINYPILFRYLKESGKPVVWTLHDIWSFTGHCAYYELDNSNWMKDCLSWQSNCHKCQLTHTYPKSFTDFSHRNFRMKKAAFNGVENMILVPVSNWLDGLLKQSFLKDYKTCVIHNGIDVSVFNVKDDNSEIKRKYGVSAEKIIIGVASPFTPKKGFDDFIQMRRMLPDEYQIVLVGLTTEQINLLPAGITGIARTQNISELASLYSAADVFVNLTYADNFPTTNLEALACGTPVVTYQTGGSPEALDENTGMVVSKGALADAVEAVIKICQTDRDYYKRNCRVRAEKFYNKSDCFSKYIELYNEMTCNQ